MDKQWCQAVHRKTPESLWCKKEEQHWRKQCLILHCQTASKKSSETSRTQQGNQCCKLCKINPKGFYSYVNERRIIRDNVGPLKTPTGKIVTTDIEMVNTLNTYFKFYPRTTKQHSTAAHICRQHTRHIQLQTRRCTRETKPPQYL